MRYPLLFLACCFARCVATSSAAIDLTPTLSEHTAEGIVYNQLLFRDGPRQITYELPSQWRYRSVGNSIKLIPSRDSTADVVIQAAPLVAPQPLDDKAIAAIHVRFVEEIPPTAQNAQVIGEYVNTVPFKGPNCELTANYQALGEVLIRRALYINLPDTQLIFRLTARKSEFEGLWRTFRASVLSWQWIEPAAPVGPVTASK